MKKFKGRPGTPARREEGLCDARRGQDHRRDHRALRRIRKRKTASHGVKTYKPTTPGQRGLVLIDRSELWKGRPVKSLTEGLTGKGGRNNTGRITMRRRGGGVKRLYRVVDFQRTKLDVPAKVIRIEYDPNRTAFIALIGYADGEQAYILAPQRLAVGDTVIAGRQGRHQAGQRDALHRDADRHDRAQRRDEGGQGRADRPRRRHLRPVRRPRRRLRADPALVGRAAPGAAGVHGDGRGGVEPGQLEPEHRQGRPQPPQGHPPERPRRGDEPDRPPARRRRRPHLAAAGIRSRPWGKPTKGARTRSNKATSKYILRSRHQRKKK